MGLKRNKRSGTAVHFASAAKAEAFFVSIFLFPPSPFLRKSPKKEKAAGNPHVLNAARQIPFEKQTLAASTRRGADTFPRGHQ
jgi:hypothetical protein